MSEVTTTAVAPAAPAAPARQALPLSLKSLLDAGVHFGHQTKRWNPKMRPYIYGARGGVHIVDLDKTARLFARAFRFVEETSARNGNILFVGTKRQAADIIQEEAARCGASFVVNRWLGGTLTNFRTIKQGLERLATLERMKEDGTYEQFRKKEVSRMEKERERLEKYLGGLKGMNGLPAAIFVIDPAMESIAVDEANKLGIPVVAITDTNCNPDLIQYVIPGNDDAIRSIKLITSRLADAVLQGAQQRKDVPREDVPVRGGAGGEGFGRGHRGERGERGERGPRVPREASN